MLIISAIAAEINGDYSGTTFIGKCLLGIGCFFFVIMILTGITSDGTGTVFVFSLVTIILGGILAGKEN